jgi:hypothetical protein
MYHRLHEHAQEHFEAKVKYEYSSKINKQMQNGIVGDAGGGTVAIKAAILACVRVKTAILSSSICWRLNARGWGFFLGAMFLY